MEEDKIPLIMEDSSMTEEDESLFEETFEKKEEKKVKVEEAETLSSQYDSGLQFSYKVAEHPSIYTGPRFQLNYEDVRNLSWIFGLVLILIIILARWNANSGQKPSVRETIIIKSTIESPTIESPDYRFLDLKHLSFLWRFCNRTTLECSWCPPGWTEHDSRCYLMFNYTQTWKKAQHICSQCLGRLPVVLNARDQMLLSRMAAQHRKKTVTVRGVWIGLKDIEEEGNFNWVSGKRLALNNSFWHPGDASNPIPRSDNSVVDEDCVAIIPPKSDTEPHWYYTWDDIVCTDQRHFICEIPLFFIDAKKFLIDNILPPDVWVV